MTSEKQLVIFKNSKSHEYIKAFILKYIHKRDYIRAEQLTVLIQNKGQAQVLVTEDIVKIGYISAMLDQKGIKNQISEYDRRTV